MARNSFVSRLERLEEVRGKGLLSENEFQGQRDALFQEEADRQVILQNKAEKAFEEIRKRKRGY